MQFLQEVIISVLKLSKGEPVLYELVEKDTKVASKTTKSLLQILQKEGLVYLQNGLLQTNVLQRVSLAVRALQLGADYERVSGFLDWKEFERLAAAALEVNGYTVKLNLRFKQDRCRWEMDIIGCRRPFVVCVDCKHWRRGLYPSKLRKVVDEQVRRTVAFSEFLPNQRVRIECASWEKTIFLPVVVSFMPTSFRFYNGTPVVPVLQLQDFLLQLPMLSGSLRRICKVQSHLKIA